MLRRREGGLKKYSLQYTIAPNAMASRSDTLHGCSLSVEWRQDAYNDQNATQQTHAWANNDSTGRRLQHERMNPLLRTPESMAMRNDMLASNDPSSKIDGLLVEAMSRTPRPTLPPRFKRDPKQSVALPWSLNRNRYLKRGAVYSTAFHCPPSVTNSSLRRVGHKKRYCV